MKIQVINNSKIKTEIKESDLIAWVSKIGDELHRTIIEQKGDIFSPFEKIKKQAEKIDPIDISKKNILLHELDKKIIVAFVSEQEMQKLNKEFRKKEGVTDILSFAPTEEYSLGEIALCLPFIYRTKPGDFSSREWLYYLILHGILHLLGFEHENNPNEARKMYHIQDTVFKKCIDEKNNKTTVSKKGTL